MRVRLFDRLIFTGDDNVRTPTAVAVNYKQCGKSLSSGEAFQYAA